MYMFSPKPFLAISIALLFFPISANALEFRKCSIDAAFSGAGVPATTIPGTNFVGWARTNSGTRSAKAINLISKSCLKTTLSTNADRIPQQCESRVRALNTSTKKGYGLTAFSVTNGLLALKNAVCANPNTGTNFGRTRADVQFDRRIVEGFRVTFRKRGGTGACRGDNLWPTTSLNIVCKASPDLMRFDRLPNRLYRRDTSGLNTTSCKAPFAMREHGASTDEARNKAKSAWIAQITRNYGIGFADPKNVVNTDMKCARTIKARYPATCVFTATPCYR